MKHLYVIALALFAAVPAAAQETQASAAAKFHREFEASDTDKNGTLSRAELQARIGNMKSGGKAFDPVHARRLAVLWFTAADSNKDGKVTEAEAQALLSTTFKRYDADADGRIGPEESGPAKKAEPGQ